jgi:hypothetical protein
VVEGGWRGGCGDLVVVEDCGCMCILTFVSVRMDGVMGKFGSVLLVTYRLVYCIF